MKQRPTQKVNLYNKAEIPVTEKLTQEVKMMVSIGRISAMFLRTMVLRTQSRIQAAIHGAENLDDISKNDKARSQEGSWSNDGAGDSGKIHSFLNVQRLHVSSLHLKWRVQQRGEGGPQPT